MIANHKITHGLVWVFVFCLVAGFALTTQAEKTKVDPTEPKPDGTIYVGGTAELTGLDSIRAYTDSIYYDRWLQSVGYDVSGFYPNQKVIYGDDNRQDIYTITDPNILHLSQAACVVISSSEYSDNGDGTYTISTSPWTSQGGTLCAGERFVGQPQIGNCSGFLVGDTIVVTAGHCLDAFSCGSWAFLFGFQMVDSLTPPSIIVPADDLYFCAGIIDQTQAGELDYCVSRIDRPVVGRTPIDMARGGEPTLGDSIIVVGHPIVLPLKASGGAVVQDPRTGGGFFYANLDTYGGNSGSMVVNTSTWEIEGILVTGAPDFVTVGGCVQSNVVPNTGNTGGGAVFEGVSKSQTFNSFIPELVSSAGEIFLDQLTYSCADTVGLRMRDLDLATTGTYNILVFSSAGDSETVTLTETGNANFLGSVVTENLAIVKEDGFLQVADGQTITLIYQDADDGTGFPATVQKSSTIDCISPIISGVSVTAIGGTWATVSFTTDEAAGGQGSAGASCGTYTHFGSSGGGTTHSLTFAGLSPLTLYNFQVSATDGAGNSVTDDNAGGCYSFVTIDQADYFTEQFIDGTKPNDLAGGTITITPDGSADYYDACRTLATTYPTDPIGGTILTLGDDDSVEVALTGGAQVYLYGVPYTSVFVCGNGFVGLGSGEDDYSETIDEHFGVPARISAYWDDFNVNDGGTITSKQLADRLVITWDLIPQFTPTDSNSFQLEMFFDGTITITHLDMGSTDGIVGISAGTGTPLDFVESNLSAYGSCGPVTCYIDSDGDHFGDENDAGTIDPSGFCQPGFSRNNLDCDDSQPTVYTGAPEICDGLDNNCDSQIDGGDTDFDGVTDACDCAPTDPNRYPGNTEIPNDGIDQDCNGFDAIICYVDVDSDNHGDANDAGTIELSGSCGTGFSAVNDDCDDTKPTVYSGAPEICDSLDNNCDLIIDGGHSDTDGVADACDCNPTDPDIYPGAPEIPDDGIDQDCNNFDATICYVDTDSDTFGDENDTGTLELSGTCGTGFSANNLDCDDNDPLSNPNGTEIPNDGIDQNCDNIDAIMCYLDVDGDNYGDENDPGIIEILGVCGTGRVANNTDCNDGDFGINPGKLDIPDDGIDQDCVGGDASCCIGFVGDVNLSRETTGEVTVGDIADVVDFLFGLGTPLPCLKEADVNQTGGANPTPENVTVGDIGDIVDFLFGLGTPLPACP